MVGPAYATEPPIGAAPIGFRYFKNKNHGDTNVYGQRRVVYPIDRQRNSILRLISHLSYIGEN